MKRPYRIKLSKVNRGTYVIMKHVRVAAWASSTELVEGRFPSVNDAMNYLIGRGLITPCGLGNTALGSH